MSNFEEICFLAERLSCLHMGAVLLHLFIIYCLSDVTQSHMFPLYLVTFTDCKMTHACFYEDKCVGHYFVDCSHLVL